MDASARTDAPQPRLLLTEDHIPAAMLMVAAAAGILVLPAQNDTWWHLHSGRAMWESGWWLTTETFSFASGGQHLDNHWWLTQLLFFAAYSWGGALLLAAVAGSCAFAAVVGSWRLCRGSADVRLALFVALLLCTAPEWSVRPQVVSLALLVLSTHLVARDRLVWLPVVSLVWGNAHAMVVFGVVVAAACVAEAAAWTRARLPRALTVLALCLAAPMISPIGLHYWPRVLSTIGTSRALALQEYRAPLDLSDLPFWVLLVALAGVSVRRRHAISALSPGERALLIASGVLAVAAFSAARNVAFFAVVAVPAVSWLAAAPARAVRRARPAPWPAWVLLGGEVVAVSLFISSRWSQAGAQLGWQPLEPAVINSVAACDGPTFNTLEDGGPLMWALPGRRIFVDSRMEAYPAALLARSRAADLDGRYEHVFEEFGIRCAVVPSGSVLQARLEADDRFRATHRGARRTVFERRDGGADATAD